MTQRIDAHTRLVGIVATPIRHSKSPVMHNTGFAVLGLPYAYLAFDVQPDQFPAVMAGFRAMDVAGFNLSMPYKAAVLPYLDEVTPAAARMNACNTVVNDGGRWVGYNTDGVGFFRALAEQGMEHRGKKLVLLGAGGAANAIAVQGALDGVAECSIFNGTPEKAERLAELTRQTSGCRAAAYPLSDLDALRRELAGADLLVNATNVGMGALAGKSLIPDSSYFHDGLNVADVIYEQEETALLTLARKAGLKTMNGVGMVLYQGAEAFRLWTGRQLPLEEVKQAIDLA